MLSTVQTSAPRSVAAASAPRVRAPSARQLIVTQAHAEGAKAPMMAAAALAASMLVAGPVFADSLQTNSLQRVADASVRPAICAAQPTADICARNSANPSTPDNTIKTNMTSPVAMLTAPRIAVVADLNSGPSPVQSKELAGSPVDNVIGSIRDTLSQSVSPVSDPFSPEKQPAQPEGGIIKNVVRNTKEAKEQGGPNGQSESPSPVKSLFGSTKNVAMVADANAGGGLSGLVDSIKTSLTTTGPNGAPQQSKVEQVKAQESAPQQAQKKIAEDTQQALKRIENKPVNQLNPLEGIAMLPLPPLADLPNQQQLLNNVTGENNNNTSSSGGLGGLVDNIKSTLTNVTNATPSGITQAGQERGDAQDAYNRAQQQSAGATEGAKSFVPLQASNKDIVEDQISPAPASSFSDAGAAFLKGEK